ncbi:hypothetical protein JKP88DRAFT_271144 [Tribonema minus]|uniref:Uncharacterized protein n=1 Tax=Tribonema minus TaxID=303371 RepID=A0A836CR41_9STRA|nr:hypothetical protein JKP88DRAFT_271144 [Tribonema minus]
MDDDDGMQLNQERLKLILTQPMPSYSFAETTFSVYFALVDQYDQPQVLHGGTVITLQLLHADSKKPVNPAMLVIDSKQPLTLNSKGGCEVKLRVAEDNKLGGAVGGLRKFSIKAVAPHRDDVDPIITEPVTIVRYRLQVRDNPARPVPKEWFKDEGGRENCVEMQVHLLDKDGHEVTTRRVKLRLVLLYDNLGRVQNQEILKLSPDSKMAIDDEGKAMLRLRIEEVSKNHQKQAFRIKVEPDTDDNPTAVDVSSDVSPPIAVYSKRIKKKGKKSKDSDAAAAAAATAAIPPPGMINGGLHRFMGGPGEGDVKASLPGFGMGYGAGEGHGGAGGGGGGAMGETVHDILNAASQQHLADPGGAGDGSSGPALYHALKSVIQWTGTVVAGLTAMQWQQLGFESKPDGTPDYNRPLYKIQNPNPIIDGIIRQYANETMQNLLVLLKRIEAGGFDDSNMGSIGSGHRHDQLQHHPPHEPQVRPHVTAQVQLQGQHSLVSGSSGGGGGGRGDKTPSGPGSLLKRTSGTWGLVGNAPPGADRQGGFGDGGPMAAAAAAGLPTTVYDMSTFGGGSGGNWEEGGQGGHHRGGPGGHRSPSPPPPSGMPPIASQNSFMWGMNMGTSSQALAVPPLLSQKSMQVLFDEKKKGGGGGAGQPQYADDELRVEYILAKNFNSEQLGMLGLPAYDAGKYLVGFYKEVEVQGGETRMVLITTERVHGLQPHEQQSATTVLLDEMRKGSQSVFELQRFNTVEKMKEAAGVYYWKKMSNMERGM